MCDFDLIILFTHSNIEFELIISVKYFKILFSKWFPSSFQSAGEFEQKISVNWEQVHGKVG
jgi:hypothetical protein